MAMMKKTITIPISPPGRPCASNAEAARVVSMTSLLFARTCSEATPRGGQQADSESFHLHSFACTANVGIRMCNDRATQRKPPTSAPSGLFCPLRYDATVSLKWDFSTLADHLGHVLTQAEADLRLEQA